MMVSNAIVGNAARRISQKTGLETFIPSFGSFFMKFLQSLKEGFEGFLLLVDMVSKAVVGMYLLHVICLAKITDQCIEDFLRIFIIYLRDEMEGQQCRIQ
jgi:hypothetical protein